MTAINATAPDPTPVRLLSGIALAIGLFLLADSVTQLIQAAGSFRLADRAWRLTHLRLLFTQVTPLVLGLVFVGQYVVQRQGGWRKAGIIALALGIIAGVFTLLYLADAVAMAGSLDGQPLGQLKRNSVQVVTSGALFTFALLVSGVRSLRTRAAA